MMELSAGVIADLFIFVIILLSVWRGWVQGLAIKLAQLVSVVVAAFAAHFMAELLKKQIGRGLFVPLLKNKTGADFSAVPFAEDGLDLFADQLAYGLVYFIVFIAALILLRRVIFLLGLIDHIPVIGKLNKAGGAVLGFLIASVAIFIVCSLIFELAPKEALKGLGLSKKVIADTYLLKIFAGLE